MPVPALVSAPGRAPASAITPDSVSVLLLLSTVPPALPSAMALLMVRLLAPAWSAPPLIVTMPAPKAELLPAASVPPLMVVPPVYVFAPDSVTVPAPVLVSAPLPARTASIVPA